MSKNSDILTDDEAIEKESPLLHSIPKENPFSVPANYFDNLPSEIVGKCRKEVISGQSPIFRETPISHILCLISLYKWKLLTATGSIAIICFLIIHMNNRPVSYETLAKNIPDSLIVEHLDRNIADINVTTLEDFQEPENSTSAVKSTSDSANADQDIIAYLMNNNVSVSDIENEP
jgi:hypothetical protein